MDRRLLNYLPAILRGVRELKAVMDDGEQPEVNELWDALLWALDEQYIDTASEYGVNRWESIIGISPKAGETLDERKFAILTWFSEKLPFTIRNFKLQLERLCGTGNYAVEQSVAEYKLLVDLWLNDYNKALSILDLIQRMIPQNMVFGITNHQTIELSAPQIIAAGISKHQKTVVAAAKSAEHDIDSNLILAEGISKHQKTVVNASRRKTTEIASGMIYAAGISSHKRTEVNTKEG